jgi:hypothetical protein
MYVSQRITPTIRKRRVAYRQENRLLGVVGRSQLTHGTRPDTTVGEVIAGGGGDSLQYDECRLGAISITSARQPEQSNEQQGEQENPHDHDELSDFHAT